MESILAVLAAVGLREEFPGSGVWTVDPNGADGPDLDDPRNYVLVRPGLVDVCCDIPSGRVREIAEVSRKAGFQTFVHYVGGAPLDLNATP